MQFSNRLRFALFASVLVGCSQILASEHVHPHRSHSLQHEHQKLHADGVASMSARELEDYFIAREDLDLDARAQPVYVRDFDDALELEARASHSKHAHKRKSKGKHLKRKGTKRHQKKGRKHAKETATTDTPSTTTATPPPDTTPTTTSAVFARELDFDLASRSTKKSHEHPKSKKAASKKHKKHAKKNNKKVRTNLSKKAGKKSNKKVGKKNSKKTSEPLQEATPATEQMKASTPTSAVSEEDNQHLDARNDWAAMNRINRINQAKSSGRSVKSSGGGLVQTIKRVFHRKKAAPAAPPPSD